MQGAFRKLVDKLSLWLPWSPSTRTVLLGIEYDATIDEQREALLDDFRSRILFTYRKGFSTSLRLTDEGGDIRSDAGWGCMLRVTQMMLAQSLLAMLLGRGWRFEASRDLEAGSAYLRIISCFLDTPAAPLSLHNMVSAGQQLLGKAPSQWFGPTSAARAAAHLIDAASTCSAAAAAERAARVASPDATGAQEDEAEVHPVQWSQEVLNPFAGSVLQHVACVVFEDGPIYRAEVLERLSGGASAVILLVCRRLGVQSLNLDEYRAGIESCFHMPTFQGLASGNCSSSAHFFVGVHDDCLLFLDPHTVQPGIEHTTDIVSSRELASGLHPSRPLPLRWPGLNPSVCFCFVVRSADEFEELCRDLCVGPRSEVFEVLEARPTYSPRNETETEDGVWIVG